jgi:hypothetical protein
LGKIAVAFLELDLTNFWKVKVFESLKVRMDFRFQTWQKEVVGL